MQTYIWSRLEKQRKGVYGPKVPGRKLLLFVDDLNLPAKEKYGAQPPLELMRQVVDNGGFYDTKANEFLQIVNLVLVGAMGMPGGGRSLPSKRLLRHFSILHAPPFSGENLFRIFSKILDWSFKNHPVSWQSNIAGITALTISLYEKTKATLLPLPSKSHYLFNLRQVSELIQGITLVQEDALNTKLRNDTKAQLSTLQKLWLHESNRVFSDRLVSDSDRDQFRAILRDVVAESTTFITNNDMLD